MQIEIRPAAATDIPVLERRCWRGGEEEMRRRISDQGACSIIALDGARPVGQIYVRAYQPGFRSPEGLHDGSWWADLSGVEDRAELPPRTAMLGCWHVGWVLETDGERREAPEYRGRGIGIALLRGAIDWLRSDAAPFDAIAAKAAASEERPYLEWLGGLPLAIYASLGFATLATYDDPYLLAEPTAVPAEAMVTHPARFHLVRLSLPPAPPDR